MREPEFIEVSEIESGYETWSAREIKVRIPDGANSGSIEVRTPHGRSRPEFFDVSGRPGVKNFKDKRTYTVSYSVDIRVLDATRPNTLYLWIPKPISSPSQRNISMISRNTEPFIENHKGVSLFKLDNITSGSNHSVSLSFRVEVYAVETSIRPQSIRLDTQRGSAVYAIHTQSSELIPSDNQRLRTTVNSIIGREQNPHTKAKAIYDWILRNVEISDALPSATFASTNVAVNVITALDERKADPYTSALLYTTMLRAAGVPCIPIAGVLIDRSGISLKHHWTEFWIEGFGWIPVDPAMGSGAVVIESLPTQGTVSDPAAFYFGNMDNTRIAFSRGELALSQMENRGRLVSHNQSYSIQNIWEEASGGLESYSSLWGDIIISGIY